MNLPRRWLIIIVISVLVIGALGIYNFLYASLIRELRVKYLECRECEDDVSYARNLIESVKIIGTKTPLLTEENISIAIGELTKNGKSKGIDLISMTPREKEKKKEAQYEILPIAMEIESTYEELGDFLGSLDELENSLITVSSFETTPYSKKDRSSLKTELVIDMYLLGEKYAE